ncbi:putative membrane protein [Streptomyces davaonensis JCM 4913]|uniref:Putative membrane protein n=1 Tax=Streptomyces davaonensis (strain DSM 101723 / JCM 4913 / KCC S-0913 / 768) TaxID=1214101 RepID=K4R572_STRDJ|nr:hypothetical protein [Streptomyces davaonensis]CCK28235.1 putative membrane protein [Streptomyces davaonensis JCM 4913]
MTEPTRHRRIRQPFIYGGTAALAAAGLLTAYLLGAFEKRGHIDADDICRNVPNRKATAQIFNSELARSARYDFTENWRPDPDWSFISRCTAHGDDDRALFTLHAKAGPDKSWQQWAKTHIPPNDGGEITYFDAGVKGLSNAEIAALWMPCYTHEKTSNSQYNMTVYAFAIDPLEASDKEARQTLIDLAISFARKAHKDAKCDLPSKLPN